MFASFAQQFLRGILQTLVTAGLSGTLGVVLGFVTAFAVLSGKAPVARVARAYILIVRGIPELLIILVVYFGGAAAVSAIVGHYVEVGALAAGVAALTVVFGAYSAEVFRGATQSLPPGQTEAALSLGLTSWRLWLLIIMPQMMRIALPSLCNLWISLLKDTSLISVVGMTDIMRVAFIGAGITRDPLTFYLAASALYLSLTSLSLLIFKYVELRMLVPYGGK